MEFTYIAFTIFQITLILITATGRRPITLLALQLKVLHNASIKNYEVKSTENKNLLSNRLGHNGLTRRLKRTVSTPNSIKLCYVDCSGSRTNCISSDSTNEQHFFICWQAHDMCKQNCILYARVKSTIKKMLLKVARRRRLKKTLI